MLIPPDRQSEEDDILKRVRNGERIDHFETVRMAKDGRRLDISLTVSPVRDDSGEIIGASKIARDMTALKQAEAERMRLLQENAAVTETLNNVGAIVASDLDRAKVVQAVTDAATELTTAEFGAFFYNVVNEHGESYTLYTISGVPREAFSKFPMPRNTEVFEPTFKGTGRRAKPRHHEGSALRSQRAASRHADGPLAGAKLSGRAGQGPVGRCHRRACSSAIPASDRFTEQHERLAVGRGVVGLGRARERADVHERAGGQSDQGRLSREPLSRAADAAQRHPRLRPHVALGHRGA